jgi:hypothetical protein
VSRWQTGSEPGTVVSLQRAFGRSNSRVFKGGLDLPRMTVAPGQSRLRGCMAAPSTRFHALGQMAVPRLKMMYFSLRKIALVNHRAVEQALGNGRSSYKPLLGADRFVCNTKLRGFQPGALARKNVPASLLLNGLMYQFHKRGTKSIQRTLRSNQAHNMANRPSDQRLRRDAIQRTSRVFP